MSQQFIYNSCSFYYPKKKIGIVKLSRKLKVGTRNANQLRDTIEDNRGLPKIIPGQKVDYGHRHSKITKIKLDI